jgi:hypothetical protein
LHVAASASRRASRRDLQSTTNTLKLCILNNASASGATVPPNGVRRSSVSWQQRGRREARTTRGRDTRALAFIPIIIFMCQAGPKQSIGTTCGLGFWMQAEGQATDGQKRLNRSWRTRKVLAAVVCVLFHGTLAEPGAWARVLACMNARANGAHTPETLRSSSRPKLRGKDSRDTQPSEPEAHRCETVRRSWRTYSCNMIPLRVTGKSADATARVERQAAGAPERRHLNAHRLSPHSQRSAIPER